MKRSSRGVIAVSSCAIVAVVVVSLYLTMRVRESAQPRDSRTWSTITSVRVDFGALVTNRLFVLGSAGNPLRAELTLREMYFHAGDFVLPFKGRLSCARGTCDCSAEVRAPVRFERGRLYAGELRLAAFTPHDLDLAGDEDSVAASLFGMLRRRIEIRPLEVDREFKAVHSIYNDFIEFEK